MHYKIVNKDCSLYKELHALRTKELEIGKKNIELIEEKVGQKFNSFLGSNSQQTVLRVPQYIGFEFEDNTKLDPKVWIKHKDHEHILVPNKKTKAGKEMHTFLRSELGNSFYNNVFDILGVDVSGNFTFPYLQIAGEILLLYIGDDIDPKNDKLIEITRKEFIELQQTS